MPPSLANTGMVSELVWLTCMAFHDSLNHCTHASVNCPVGEFSVMRALMGGALRICNLHVGAARQNTKSHWVCNCDHYNYIAAPP